jgi:hypothetical protein
VVIPSYIPYLLSLVPFLIRGPFSRLCHSCGLHIEGTFVGALGATTKYHLQCFRSIGDHEDHESILQVIKVTKPLLRETQPGVASAEQKVELQQYNTNLVFKPGEAIVSPDCKYQAVL